MAKVVTPVTSQPSSGTASPTPQIGAQLTSQYEITAKTVLAQLVKIAKISHRNRGPTLVKNAEVQNMLDNELFLIQPDRRSKLTALQQFRLIHVLAQFFQERIEDGSRYSYFEALFLGREGDSVLHDYRIDLMMQLASFSLQFPVLQVINLITTWLSKMTDPKMANTHSEMLIEMIVDHFIRTDSNKDMFEYLIPLMYSCGEFTAIFTALAPLQSGMCYELCVVLNAYLQKNMKFIMKHLRDTPYLLTEFAEQTLPLLVRYAIEVKDDSPEVTFLTGSLSFIFMTWDKEITQNSKNSQKVYDHSQILDLLLEDRYPWTKRRMALITAVTIASGRPKQQVEQRLEEMQLPLGYNFGYEEFLKADLQDFKKVTDEADEKMEE